MPSKFSNMTRLYEDIYFVCFGNQIERILRFRIFPVQDFWPQGFSREIEDNGGRITHQGPSHHDSFAHCFPLQSPPVVHNQ
jgi:hypothetical protein